MFWTNILEKYETFLSKSTERMSVLNKDPWIYKRNVAAMEGAAGKAEFSTEKVSRYDYEREVRLITDAWNGSSKGGRRSQTLREALTPYWVPEDHLYYDLYFNALTFLCERSTFMKRESD